VTGSEYLVPKPLDDQGYTAILPTVVLLVPKASTVDVEFADIPYPNVVVHGVVYLLPNPLLDQLYTDAPVALPAEAVVAKYFAFQVFPRRSFMEIVPDGIPARSLTFVSFNDICAVLDKPNSTLTSDIEIVPVGVVT